MNKQQWQIGNSVKVGFLTLRVTGKQELADRADKYVPCAWFLESLDGSKQYEFTPHYGLEQKIVVGGR